MLFCHKKKFSEKGFPTSTTYIVFIKILCSIFHNCFEKIWFQNLDIWDYAGFWIFSITSLIKRSRIIAQLFTVIKSFKTESWTEIFRSAFTIRLKWVVQECWVCFCNVVSHNLIRRYSSKIVRPWPFWDSAGTKVHVIESTNVYVIDEILMEDKIVQFRVAPK